MVTISLHTTVHLAICADGRVLPPFVIYEKSLPSGAYRDGIPDSWLFGYKETDVFIQWFQQIFIRNVGRGTPRLLLMDKHDSHLSPAMIDLAKEHQI